MRALGFGEVWVPPLQTGGRTRRQMNQQGSSGAIHRLGDMGKELPEDEELSDFLDADIPGLTNIPERSFDFVTSEVRTQLAHLPPEQVDEILTLLGGFESTVFDTRGMPRMSPPRQLDMDITETPDARPVAMRHYPVAPQHMPELERQIKVLLDAGIIRESVSLYASPVLFEPKKDGKSRFCVDCRRLNRQILWDCYPTPVASDLILRTWGSRMFSKLDLQSGFHQLRIREGDQHKTAFTTPGGQYDWVTCPFSLTNTPNCFQRLMNHVLRGHIAGHNCVVYCDDVLIFTNTHDPEEHLHKRNAVLETLRAHELLIKGSKTELFRSEVEFLGFQLSKDGWAPTELKVTGIVEWLAPETVKHLHSFLGMANFFRTFIPLYSDMSSPLTELLKDTKGGQQTLQWFMACQTAFVSLKTALTSVPILQHIDPALRTVVHIDGSQNTVGAVLLQWLEDEEYPRPVAFMSRKLKGTQYRYDVRNVEALGAQVAIQTWHTLLLGQKFDIYSDHGNLQYFFTQKSLSQRILRLCEFLSDFNFEEIKYVSGAHNVVPDFLSRPWDWTCDEVPTAIHVLAACTSRRLRKTAAPIPLPSVVVLPSWQGSVTVQTKYQRTGLWSVTTGTNETSRDAASRAVRSLEQDFRVTPTLICVAHTEGVSLWRAEFGGDHMPHSLNNTCQWMSPQDLPQHKHWYQSHFDVLTHFGVWSSGRNSTIFKIGNSPSVGNQTVCALKGTPPSKDLPRVSTLLHDIRAAVPDDAFLVDVLQPVLDSDDNFYRDFLRLQPPSLFSSK